MGLTKVWVTTLSDGLIRADRIVGVKCHPTPQLPGKRSRWLVDVVLEVAAGSGIRGEWDLGALHRTLLQAPQEPSDAPVSLVRLLAQLDAADAAGLITPHLANRNGADPSAEVRYSFTPFPTDNPTPHPGQTDEESVQEVRRAP